ncbi:MAG: hypothetical protein WCG08_13470 [Paludibacter sp.]|jgi:hypothetical protein
MKTQVLIIATFFATMAIFGQKKKEVFSQENYGLNNAGTGLTIQFEKGVEHNHPLFAVWLADENGKYIQTLYVSESIGKAVFHRVNRKTGHWKAGEIQRPATLPYWAHQRGEKNEFGTYMPTPKQPVADAYTGATPSASFILHAKTEKPLSGKYKIMLELNQSWDWNEYWTNDKYPNDKEYKTSSQPALVYSADIDTASPNQESVLKLIGHSHYSGADGSLDSDLSTITTALKIAKKITVKLY